MTIVGDCTGLLKRKERKRMTKVERHMDICKMLNGVYEQKNHDYGDSFHDTFVEEGMAMARIRLSDKLNRFKKLTRMSEDRSEGFKNVPMVKDESIRDTLLDLANYAIMTVMEMDILAEEDARTKIKTAINEHKNYVNSSHIRYTCPVCGSFMLFEKELDRYVCDNCGATYGVKASNGKPDGDPDPCEKCTYNGKGIGCECVDRVEWERRQRGDADAIESEPVNG
jgi:ribosomal protein S27AE